MAPGALELEWRPRPGSGEWRRVRCPGVQEAYRRLHEKYALAKKAIVVDPETRRWSFDLEAVLKAAVAKYGELQRVDETVEISMERKLAGVIDTVPGLTACIHRYVYEAKGELRNDAMVIEGPGGVGKSSYAYWLARLLGGEIIADREELVEKLKRLAGEGRWVPVLVLDDVSKLVSKYWVWVREERKWVGFFKVIELAKDWAGVLLFTTRSFEGAAKRFREISSLVGSYRRLVIHDAYLVDVIVWQKPGGKTPVALDILWPGLRMPSDYFEEMLEKRRAEVLRALEELEEEPGGEGGEDDGA